MPKILKKKQKDIYDERLTYDMNVDSIAHILWSLKRHCEMFKMLASDYKLWV